MTQINERLQYFRSRLQCTTQSCVPLRPTVMNIYMLVETERNSNYVFLPCAGEQMLKSLVCQVCLCALARGTSVFKRMCKCGCGIVCACVSVLFTSWLDGSGQGGDAVCRLLSSLYSNDRPCCFTCCGGPSAVELSPCTSPSL